MKMNGLQCTIGPPVLLKRAPFLFSTPEVPIYEGSSSQKKLHLLKGKEMSHNWSTYSEITTKRPDSTEHPLWPFSKIGTFSDRYLLEPKTCLAFQNITTHFVTIQIMELHTEALFTH